MARWQQEYRVDWDAADGRNGGAQQTAWEILLEMERFNGKAKEEDQGALALVLDLAKALERVSLPVVWAWATHFSFPKEVLRVLYGYFEQQRRVQFEGCVADHHGHSARVQVELVASTFCIARCAEVTKIYPPEMARKVMKKFERGSREKRVSNCRSQRMERKERAR